jgi:hypothetical protein
MKQPSSSWLNDKSLELRDLLPLWFQIRAMWLLIWWLLETYIVINFKARGISRDACKLPRTPTLIIYIKKVTMKPPSFPLNCWIGAFLSCVDRFGLACVCTFMTLYKQHWETIETLVNYLLGIIGQEENSLGEKLGQTGFFKFIYNSHV